MYVLWAEAGASQEVEGSAYCGFARRRAMWVIADVTAQAAIPAGPRPPSSRCRVVTRIVRPHTAFMVPWREAAGSTLDERRRTSACGREREAVKAMNRAAPSSLFSG